MAESVQGQSGTSREAKTWLLLVLAGVALLMFVAGFVLVLT